MKRAGVTMALLGVLGVSGSTHAKQVSLSKLPAYPVPAELPEIVQRGTASVYQDKPSSAKIVHDKGAGFNPKRNKITNNPHFKIGKTKRGAWHVQYVRVEGSFSGAYLMLVGDLKGYQSLSFLIKGRRGKETFELGLNDWVSHQREDSIRVGSIYRYLPEGITPEWQLVTIPLSHFRGADLSKAVSLVFLFDEVGAGDIWVDELRFSTEKVIDWKVAASHSTLVFDNFDHSDLNLLGHQAAAYKRLPSVCRIKRVTEPRVGKEGRSLQVVYNKKAEGWCGYYSLLNPIDGDYFDLTPYKVLSFMVKGEKGGEQLELGMADKRLLDIGDSNKGGQISDFLQGGITKGWKEVRVPLKVFNRGGPLDFSKMGSVVFNFNRPGQGTVYFDDVKFYRESSPPKRRGKHRSSSKRRGKKRTSSKRQGK